MHAGIDSSDNVDRCQTAGRQSDFRPINPTFLRALGLIKTHKKQAKPVAANARVVKKGRVAKPEAPAKKRSHAASVDKPERKPAVAANKSRAAVAPAAANPATKTKAEAKPRAPQALYTANDCIVTDDDDVLKPTSSADQFRMWVAIIESDFDSLDYVRMLKKCSFTEAQIDAIQKSLQHLCQTILRKAVKEYRYMKTYMCTECNFSVSHECSLIHYSNSWPVDPYAPYTEFITPNAPHMCSCNFTFFHSHEARFWNKHAPEESSTVPNTLPMLENNRSLEWSCHRCCMKLAVLNRKNKICQDFVNFISLDDPLRRMFYNYVYKNVEFYSKECPNYTVFWGCTKLCCMMHHPCTDTQNAITPIQPHRPLASCLAIP